MRAVSSGRFRARLIAIAGITMAVACASSPAQARLRHHHFHIFHQTYQQPVLQPDTGFGPTAPGASSIMIDAGTGSTLAATGADIPRYPASLTKLMTLDLAFQALRDGRLHLDQVLPVSEHASAVEPVKLGLVPGSVITVRQAILAMTTMSANDAATVLGEYLGGGSEDRCGQMMTLRAHALGMAQTEFYNASGLPNPNQVTTARDLSILARDIVVNFPQDQTFFEQQNFDFNGRTIYSNNAMLKIYPGTTGMKTGYTILARHNLVTSAMRNGHELIGVVLHEPSWGQTYQLMTAMLNSGFDGQANGNSTMLAANQSQTPPAPAIVAPAPVQLAQNTPSMSPVASHHRLGNGLGLVGGYQTAGWTAQIGLYSHMNKARFEAISAHDSSGVGIPRIARVQRHGRILWTAQLAGLTLNAAHETCSARIARRASCMIIAPQADHLAMRDNLDG